MTRASYARTVAQVLREAYDRRPATVVIGLSAILLAAVWSGPFFGGQVIPYDYQTAHYPWYVDAIRAARYDFACLYNPFNDAGQPTWNIYAFNDPIQWLPVFLPHLPGYTALQSLELAHLILVPCGLLLVARANGVPKERWILIVGISLIGFAIGPCLKYMQQSVGIVAYAYLVLMLGALEAFRTTGNRWYALLAGACAAYVFEAFIYPAVFLPVALAGYALANFRELFASRSRLISLALAMVVAAVIAAPAVLISEKIDHLIEASRHLEQLSEILPTDLLFQLGAPSQMLKLVALPAALIALCVLGFSHVRPQQRVFYGAVIVALALYGFGDSTPFGPIFRDIYPPADLIRRPYATWYVLLPLVLMMSTIGLRGGSRKLVICVTAVSACAIAGSLFVDFNPASCVVLFVSLAVAVMWPRTSFLVGIAVFQWVVIDWSPFLSSNWHPAVIPADAMYMRPYESVRSYFGTAQAKSSAAFRIANIGLPAQVGPSAGMYEYYNVAADYNTFIPHELVTELGTDELHGTTLPGYVAADPEALGSVPWERLAVTYYLVSPSVLASIPARDLSPTGLHVVETASYWKVLKDERASPFVAALSSTGRPSAIDATMTRDSFRFNVPLESISVRFAMNFDTWWHAYDLSDGNRTISLHNSNGQLELPAVGLAGHLIAVRYGNRLTRISLVASIGIQIALAGLFILALIARRRAVASTSTGSFG
jgi:hypothetical protein